MLVVRSRPARGCGWLCDVGLKFEIVVYFAAPAAVRLVGTNEGWRMAVTDVAGGVTERLVDLPAYAPRFATPPAAWARRARTVAGWLLADECFAGLGVEAAVGWAEGPEPHVWVGEASHGLKLSSSSGELRVLGGGPGGCFVVVLAVA